MKIKALSSFIEKENLQNYTLLNSSVVVDAQNFFYKLYERSGLQYIYGCESDKYAEYLRNYLIMFKNANVKCYFVFKGGHEDSAKRHNKLKESVYWEDFDVNKLTEEYIVLPIFMKDVYKQVLDEMGFDYTICEFESKRECIALAQKLKCPVVSQDIEFCFSGVPYIMQSTIKYDQLNNSIQCGIFSLDDFLKKNHLTEEKLAVFAALTDEKGFPENHFINLFQYLRINVSNPYLRIKSILLWLARNTRQDALKYIFTFINQEDKETFLAIESKVKEMIRRQEEPGIPAMYLLNGNQIEITDKDEFWFQKGVASKYIAIQYVNLTHTEIFEGTWAIADYTDIDPRLLSEDIIKYAFNLLTNFEKEHLIMYKNGEEIIIPVTNSISKPEYGGNSPFEGGWTHLKGDMFKHFLNESIERFYFDEINYLPEDLKMLMTALIYFSAKKTSSTRNEVCSIILSYIALGVLKDVGETEETAIKYHDKINAKDALAKYSNRVSMKEAKMMFDVELLHPLVQFQHCLENLNFLNTLCGIHYQPTIYSKTFNGTLVYKVLYTITTKYDGNCMVFLNKELRSAPSILSFVLKLMGICGIN